MDDRDAPALKGFILESLWRDLHELMKKGKLEREAVEAFLDADELAILDEKIEPTLWYPNRTYHRFAELIGRAVGAVGETYWIERGRRAVERLMRNGSVVERMIEGARSHGPSAGQTLMKLPALVFSYGRWEIRPGQRPGDFVVQVRDAEAMPESLRLSLQGAGELIAERLLTEPMRISSSRPSLDHVIFEGRSF